jgi:hypothetical protein
LPTTDGSPLAGHLTTLSLGFVVFQVHSVDFLAAEPGRRAVLGGWKLGCPQNDEALAGVSRADLFGLCHASLFGPRVNEIMKEQAVRDRHHRQVTIRELFAAGSAG